MRTASSLMTWPIVWWTAMSSSSPSTAISSPWKETRIPEANISAGPWAGAYVYNKNYNEKKSSRRTN